jgi:response regulator RpfG family c-di-GMP phosphodiesterase
MPVSIETMEKIKVVLVDNDPDELFFMEKGFESSDLFSIIAQFSNGLELYEFLDDTDELPDLIVTDLNMPWKSGIDIAKEISSNTAYESVKVVVLSITPESNRAYFQESLSGKSLFIPKPTSMLEYKSFAIALYDKIHAELS